MLIDFIGENIEDGVIITDIKLYEYLNNCAYEIGVREIVLEIKSGQINEKDANWMINTNLIDRCSANEKQALSIFTMNAHKNRYHIQFSPVTFHRLERIHTAPRFELNPIFKSTSLKIKDILIRLEIRKTCLDSQSR